MIIMRRQVLNSGQLIGKTFGRWKVQNYRQRNMYLVNAALTM